MNRASKAKTTVFIIALSAVFFLTGCWGVAETDELAYVLAMGIDPGENNIVKVSFQIAVPKALAGGKGGEGGGGEPVQNISVEAASIFGALQLANAFVSRELTLIHNRLVVVSEEIAQEGLNKYINPLIRSREIRRNTFIMVTRGKAWEFLKENKPVLEINPAPQFELLLGEYRRVGFLAETIINDFYSATKVPGNQPVLALVGIASENKTAVKAPATEEERIRREVAYFPGEVPREGGNKIEAIGLAVFRGDRLAGYLNGAETRYYQMLASKFYKAIFTFPDPERPEKDVVVMEITAGRKPYKDVKFIDGKPVLNVEIILEGDIRSLQSGINYERGEKLRELEEYLEDYMRREAMAVLKKTQEEFKSDVLGFGEKTRKYFWTYPAWKDFNWNEIYPQAEVNLQVDLRIRRPGLILKTAPVEGDEWE